MTYWAVYVQCNITEVGVLQRLLVEKILQFAGIFSPHKVAGKLIQRMVNLLIWLKQAWWTRGHLDVCGPHLVKILWCYIKYIEIFFLIITVVVSISTFTVKTEILFHYSYNFYHFSWTFQLFKTLSYRNPSPQSQQCASNTNNTEVLLTKNSRSLMP